MFPSTFLNLEGTPRLEIKLGKVIKIFKNVWSCKEILYLCIFFSSFVFFGYNRKLFINSFSRRIDSIVLKELLSLRLF